MAMLDQAGHPGQYVIVLSDPETPGAGEHAIGPIGEGSIVVQTQRVRQQLDQDGLNTVNMRLVPCQPPEL